MFEQYRLLHFEFGRVTDEEAARPVLRLVFKAAGRAERVVERKEGGWRLEVWDDELDGGAWRAVDPRQVLLERNPVH